MLAAQGNVKGEAPMLRLRSAVTAFMIGACLAGSPAVTVAYPIPDDPPFVGTSFISPDIITASDPTALESVVANGQGSRTMFDRRVDAYVVVNARLFNATFEDGLTAEVQVNPEFDAEQAFDHAFKYAVEIGRLPYVLRIDVHAVWIHDGVNPFGGADNALLIHVGQGVLYENDGVLNEILMHEASHTSLDDEHAAAPGWIAAQDSDPAFISEYARDNPDREDVAETSGPGSLSGSARVGSARLSRRRSKRQFRAASSTWMVWECFRTVTRHFPMCRIPTPSSMRSPG
jgi:hypothetical protein